jgi:hypothetical protein
MLLPFALGASLKRSSSNIHIKGFRNSLVGGALLESFYWFECVMGCQLLMEGADVGGVGFRVFQINITVWKACHNGEF